MDKHEKDHLVEQYLNKKLEGIELHRFESLLQSDAELAEELKLEMELREAIDDSSYYNVFKRIVEDVSDEYFNPKTHQPLFTPLRIAASISLLAVASWLVWWNTRPLTPDEIFDQYFEPYIIQTTPRGLTEDTEAFMMGTVLYRDGNYELAIDQFKMVLQENPLDYRAKLKLGISYMALKQYDEAEPVLVDLVNDPDHLFQDRSRWYLGLLYLMDKRVGNVTKSKIYFNGIKDKTLQERAQEIRR